MSPLAFPAPDPSGAFFSNGTHAFAPRRENPLRFLPGPHPALPPAFARRLREGTQADSPARNRSVQGKRACQPTASCFTLGYAGSCYNSLMSEFHQMQRESLLISQIREHPPEFAEACASDVDVVLLNQDAFAADYRDEEYKLLGMAIKYAGLSSKEVHVIGKNRQTLGGEAKTQ